MHKMEIKIEDSNYGMLQAAVQHCEVRQDRLLRILQAVQRDVAEQRIQTSERFQLLEEAVAAARVYARSNHLHRQNASQQQHSCGPTVNMGQGISHDNCNLRITRPEAGYKLFDEELSRRIRWLALTETCHPLHQFKATRHGSSSQTYWINTIEARDMVSIVRKTSV
jgi:hypothetical protein